MQPQAVIRAHGLELAIPVGWNAEIFRLGDGSPADGDGPLNLTTRELENSPPVLHAATLDLPRGRGTYATEMIDRLGHGDAFVAVIDHGPEQARQEVFSMGVVPWPLLPDHFDPSASPQTKTGLVFVQRFFNQRDRAFALFAGIDEGPGRAVPVGRVNALLAGLKVMGH